MKVKKKLIISISALIITLFLATGSTFAWISINNKATVGDFDIKISTGSNALDISLDGTIYYNTISKDKIFDKIGVENGTGVDTEWKMSQVTYLSKKEIDNDTNDLIKDVDGNKISTPGYYILEEETESPNTVYKSINSNSDENGRYLSIPLYFRSNSAVKQEIYLYNTSNSSVVVPVKSDENAKKAAVAYGKPIIKNGYSINDNDDFISRYGTIEKCSKLFLDSNDNGIDRVYSRAAYATRIGFEYQENTTTTAMKIFDPYKKSTDNSNNPSFYDNNFARDISSASYFSSVTEADKLYDTQIADDIYVTTNKDEISSGAIPLFELFYNDKTGYYEQQLTLTIWLEGRDGDCFSGVIEDDFKVSLEFVALPKGTIN